MTEAVVSEALQTVEDIDLNKLIKRINRLGNPNLPRQDLPDFSDSGTYNLLYDLAHQLRDNDPKYKQDLLLIPSYEDFIKSPTGSHFAGIIPRTEIGEEGNRLMRAMSRVMLDIPNGHSGSQLVVAREGGTGKAIGFVNFTDFGTVQKSLQSPENTYQFQKLLDVLSNSNDPYWEALAGQHLLPLPAPEQLSLLRGVVFNTSVVTPNQIYTAPEHREKGVITRLIQQIYQGRIVVGTTSEAATVCLRRKALPNHITLLAPALKIEAEPPLAHIAFAVMPLALYEEQYRDLVTAKSPTQKRFAAFADIKNVAAGRFTFDQEDDVDKDVLLQDIKRGKKEGLLSSREVELLSDPNIGRLQYPIISIPNHSQN